MKGTTILCAAVLGLALAAAAGGDAAAEKAATDSAAKWLAVVDAGKYGESWDAAAALFRRAITRAGWEEAVAKVRGPLGKVRSRTLQAAQFTTTLPNAPPGEYVVIQYRTDFESRREAIETVTPMKDPDGVWRVSGYYIR